MPFAIAQALGVPQSDEQLVDTLARHLEDRSLLLLVDNFEQVAAAADTLAALAAAAPRLLVLTTSRLPLRISGEHEYPVPPLPLPSGGAAFEEVAASDAVRLFLSRAQAVDPGFALTDENVEPVVAICRGLDGLPLAIELAAARIRQLPPAQIALRLDRALELLTQGPRDLPERQQTLRAALDWSYRLLPEPERALLARLAVFAGSFSLDAVDAVVADEEDPLDGLTALVDGSLLRRVDAPAGAARFVLLETIRAYGLERLRATGEDDEYARRHAVHYREIAEEANASFVGDGYESAFETLDLERDNLRGALAWAAGAGEIELETRIAVALRWYWVMRGGAPRSPLGVRARGCGNGRRRTSCAGGGTGTRRRDHLSPRRSRNRTGLVGGGARPLSRPR